MYWQSQFLLCPHAVRLRVDDDLMRRINRGHAGVASDDALAGCHLPCGVAPTCTRSHARSWRPAAPSRRASDPVLRRIAGQRHPIDGEHLTPDEPVPVADRQHRREDRRDLVAPSTNEAGTPNQDPYIERFNRTLGREVLDAWVFTSLADARAVRDVQRLRARIADIGRATAPVLAPPAGSVPVPPGA